SAENAIKQFAYYREGTVGVMREPGLSDYLVLLSIYQTCRYRGISFLKFLLSKERDVEYAPGEARLVRCAGGGVDSLRLSKTGAETALCLDLGLRQPNSMSWQRRVAAGAGIKSAQWSRRWMKVRRSHRLGGAAASIQASCFVGDVSWLQRPLKGQHRRPSYLLWWRPINECHCNHCRDQAQQATAA